MLITKSLQKHAQIRDSAWQFYYISSFLSPMVVVDLAMIISIIYKGKHKYIFFVLSIKIVRVSKYWSTF